MTDNAPNAVLWTELLACWRTLTAMLPNYEAGGPGYEAIGEARRIVEVEMRAQGYTAEWKKLTGSAVDPGRKAAAHV